MLKVQCQCGHRLAVPDDFAGKRVKCPKCKGAVSVPKGGAAVATVPRRAMASPSVAVAAPATAPGPRVHRSRRHALERKQKSHNITVAVIAGAMVVLGLGLLLFIGSMNRPTDPPAPATNVAANQSAGPGTSPSSSLPAIRKTNATPATSTGEMADGSRGDAAGENDEPAANPRFTAASAAPAIAGTTSTFDADGDITTIQAQAMPLTVAGKTLQMTMTVTHDGRDVRTATQIGAQIRISGDFTGIISGANTDEPRLTIEADGRDEFFLPPTGRDESDARKGENGAEILPKWVEFSVGKSELKAIAHAKSLRTTLGGTIFEFSDDQRKLFLALIPIAAASGDDRPLPPDEKAGSTEPGAAPGDEGDAPVEKEIMDEKEVMKKQQ